MHTAFESPASGIAVLDNIRHALVEALFPARWRETPNR